ncbi:hypothetical protein KSP40_PGU011585 [Platanthera guangdongensis]|uniref:Uncharacterized protein n=1 Tax=Platanthera guangdongensis TaxID=2320717 RepID=A0ABR2LMR3_9ASPA
MFCGTSALHQMDADSPRAPSKPAKKHHHSSSSKNPYSSRGLDKFSSVLTDLESRKKKIMESSSSQGVSMVRFMYSDSRDWIPVIVRLRDDSTTRSNGTKNSNVNKKPVLVNELSPPAPPLLTKVEDIAEPLPEKKKKKRKVVEERRWWRRRPSYYMPVAMTLILLCFVISGRAFAICCLSAFWRTEKHNIAINKILEFANHSLKYTISQITDNGFLLLPPYFSEFMAAANQMEMLLGIPFPVSPASLYGESRV